MFCFPSQPVFVVPESSTLAAARQTFHNGKTNPFRGTSLDSFQPLGVRYPAARGSCRPGRLHAQFPSSLLPEEGLAFQGYFLGQECLSANPTAPPSGACCVPFARLCSSFPGPGLGLGWGVGAGTFNLLSPASEPCPQTLPWPNHAPGPLPSLTTEVTEAVLLLASSVHPLAPQSPPTAPSPIHLECG